MSEGKTKNKWREILEPAVKTDSFKKLMKFLEKEYQEEIIYPKKEDIWTAFEWTDYEDVKVVILGQDPYHGKNQSHGLSFSVKPGVKIPPSLRNIYKELEDDIQVSTPNHGYLKEWAEQGVFLLNTVLTVRAGQAASHRGKGWEELTDLAISSLNQKDKPIVFILWGAEAKKKRALIDENKHFVLSSVHPSPLSAYRGFFGSKPFSKTNQLLAKSDQEKINWKLSSEVSMK